MKRILISLTCMFLIVTFTPPAAIPGGIAIGNADYTDGSPDLPKDINDANDMARAINGGAQVQTDRNEAQMRADVAGTAGTGSPRVIFISSHGAQGPPAEIVGVDGTRYDPTELAADLDCANNEGTVVIIDACYSGGMANPAVAECCIFLTACKADQCAHSKIHPPRDARNSEFTEHVLRGVRGAADTAPKDGEVSLQELSDYLAANYDQPGVVEHELLGMEKPWASTIRPFKPVIEQVPTLSEWGLVVLLALLLLSGAYAIYRRRSVCNA